MQAADPREVIADARATHATPGPFDPWDDALLVAAGFAPHEINLLREARDDDGVLALQRYLAPASFELALQVALAASEDEVRVLAAPVAAPEELAPDETLFAEQVDERVLAGAAGSVALLDASNIESVLTRPIVTVNDEELGLLHDLLVERRKVAAPFEVAVEGLVAEAKAPHARRLGEILISSFGSGEAPVVAYGPAPSVGYYSAAAHVIVLDPKKNPDADARLDTLAFEAGNALRRAEYLAKDRSTADVEFEVVDGKLRCSGSP